MDQRAPAIDFHLSRGRFRFGAQVMYVPRRIELAFDLSSVTMVTAQSVLTAVS